MGRRMMRNLNPDIRAVGAIATASGFYFFVQSFLSTGILLERLALFFGIILGMALKCYRFEDDPYEAYDTLPADGLGTGTHSVELTTTLAPHKR